MEEKEKVKERQKEETYSGIIRFQGRQYKVTEIHDITQITGKWCIAFELPGVNHRARVFAISVRYKDFQRHADDEEKFDRPAIFESKLDCVQFMEELYFPKYPLKAVELTEEVCRRNLDPALGVYLVQKPLIIIPD